MNTKLDFIFKRRSIRLYSKELISTDHIKDILEAAMSAPSACAKDPWDFIVISKKELLEKVSEGLPNGKMLAAAAAGIIICGDMNKAHTGELSYMIQDCSAAIENILLAASALGIGTCWLGVHPREERIKHIRNLFEIPGHIIPMAVVSLGYPAEKKEARTRYNSSLLHCDRW